MTPTYRWRCHKCELVNEPSISSCAHCGFPAIASAIEIAKAKGEPLPAAYGPLGKALAWLLISLP